jgi:hypothetical protein
MKKFLSFVASAIIFCACNNINGSGNITSENRNVDQFDGVQTSGSIDIEVTEGDQVSVKVKADDNVLPYIITDTDNGLLQVYFKEHTSFNNVNVKVYATAPHLKRLFVKGSGNITSNNTIKNNRSIATKVSGSGDINVTVDAPEIKAEISGSGNLSLQGRCKNFEGSVSGSGNLNCKNLLSENATVSIFGSGNAHVFASVNLKASTTGSGNIYYSGNPTSPQISKAGSGNVEAE